MTIRLLLNCLKKYKKKQSSTGISSFRHGACMGWIEIDAKSILTSNAFKWITKGYDHTIQISKIYEFTILSRIMKNSY